MNSVRWSGLSKVPDEIGETDRTFGEEIFFTSLRSFQLLHRHVLHVCCEDTKIETVIMIRVISGPKMDHTSDNELPLHGNDN